MGQEKALPWKNWEVVKLIGKGTYGDVYEIRKENTQYAARAALKVIHVSLDEQKRRELESERISLASYLQETQANITSEINIMESLKSASHIVAIEDSEIQEEPDGWTLFIRMELLKSLVQLRSERNLTMKEILKLGLDLCDGLQACRKKGVIHRDIKPANIFISEFGEYKLGDFGISKQLEHTMSGSTRAGTESYMAPEVFYGKVYDATVDLYSLGIVLYQLENKGKLPFVPQDREVVSYSDVTKAKQRRLKGEILPDPAMGGHVLGDILFAFGFHILNHFRIHLCELIGFTGNGILKIGGGVADFLRVAQMSMSMDGFSFGCGAEQLGNLGFAFLVGFLCVGEIFAVGLGFTGKSSHQMFNSLAHDVSLLKFFEGL